MQNCGPLFEKKILLSENWGLSMREEDMIISRSPQKKKPSSTRQIKIGQNDH